MLLLIQTASPVHAALPCTDRDFGPCINAFGYRMLDQDYPDCPYQFIDLSTTGAHLSLLPSGPEPPTDEGAAILDLVEPFRFYGALTSRLIVSANGYLAVAQSLGQEDGGDFSNDCPLPAVPSVIPDVHRSGVNARIMAYHDDLLGPDPGSAILWQYFNECPRESATGTESCTVIQWHRWGFAAESTDRQDFEVVLYHQTHEIGVLIAGGDSAQGGSATIGIQSPGADNPLSYACDTPGAAHSGTAVCFHHPQQTLALTPPTADVAVGNAIPIAVILSDVRDQPVPGEPVRIEVVSGPHIGLTEDGITDGQGRFSIVLNSIGSETPGDRDRLRATATDGTYPIESASTSVTWVAGDSVLIQPELIHSQQDSGVQYAKTLLLSNIGQTDLRILGVGESRSSCSDPADLPWLSAQDVERELMPGESATIEVVLDSESLSPGDYDGLVCVYGEAAAGFPIAVDVDMKVLATDVCSPADFNDDGVIDAVDYSVLISHFGQSVTAGTSGDTDGDGDVDFADYILLYKCYGQTVP